MTENEQRALGLLGLARRANRLSPGEEPTVIACRAGKARLVLLAQDAGEHTVRRVRAMCREKPPYLITAFTREELGNALGMTACALLAVDDAAFALRAAELMGAESTHPEIVALLREQTEHDKKRRDEQKAHRNNIRRGKKRAPKA